VLLQPVTHTITNDTCMCVNATPISKLQHPVCLEASCRGASTPTVSKLGVVYR
jgi:hypothetical protein